MTAGKETTKVRSVVAIPTHRSLVKDSIHIIPEQYAGLRQFHFLLLTTEMFQNYITSRIKVMDMLLVLL
ncbi:hypothetical protein D3C80_898160 [compost metagenome]